MTLVVIASEISALRGLPQRDLTPAITQRLADLHTAHWQIVTGSDYGC